MSTYRHAGIAAAALTAALGLSGPSQTALAAGSAASAHGSGEQLLILAVRGGGNWRLECDIETAGGRNYPMKQLGSGVYSTGSIVETDVVTTRCRYFAPENHMLRIALVDEAGEFRCPWRNTDSCYLEVEGEARDNFTISLK